MTTPAAVPTPPPHPRERGSRRRAARARRDSPLWRRTDRQRGRLHTLMVLGLVTAVVLAALVGVLSYRSQRSDARHEAAGLRQVQAVELSDAVPSRSVTTPGYTAQVRWTDPTGTGATHQAAATVPATGTVGSRVPVWLDAADQIRSAPPAAGVSAADSVFFGSMTLVALPPCVVIAWYLADLRLDRTDQRNWEREWQRVEPEWTRRR
ncbi:hypothetical protein [Streptacidiphilus sp. P02-A3a]|uniref:Rv1733c family protein n=1 Tax=Streptacidiphilus sp. P02-A3a TaxID=2704468 RepID=UPI0015FC32BE|nr:hypothetical protein [Streptacidiphilus sp. P02-A3a]QMU70012.1 hypothetical protein GXP74_19065 [Streptacidiphilus sp. P02-A3a]